MIDTNISITDVIDKWMQAAYSAAPPVDVKAIFNYITEYPGIRLADWFVDALANGIVVSQWPEAVFGQMSLTGVTDAFALAKQSKKVIRQIRDARNSRRHLRLPMNCSCSWLQVPKEFMEQLATAQRHFRLRWQTEDVSGFFLSIFFPLEGWRGLRGFRSGLPESIVDQLIVMELCARWAGWSVDFASYDFLVGLVRLCPWITYCERSNRVVILDRPHSLYLNEVRNGGGVVYGLHREDGPAIECRGGYKAFFLKGVQVHPWIVNHPEHISVETILAERNVEIRRVMRELYGEGRYLMDSRAEILDVDSKNVSQVDFAESRSVVRMLIRDKRGEVFLVGTDGSTGRVYYMPVPDSCNTCEQAHSVLANFDEKIIVSQS